MIILILFLSILAACLYRMGGIGKPYDTKVRDLGIPGVMVIAMFLMGNFHWSLILCFGALFGALTTYNKWAGYLLNRRDRETVHWESWLITGLFYGLSMLPYVIFNGNWAGFAYRTLILAVFTCIWSQFIGKDWLEEGGRGFIIIATLPLL